MEIQMVPASMRPTANAAGDRTTSGPQTSNTTSFNEADGQRRRRSQLRELVTSVRIPLQ